MLFLLMLAFLFSSIFVSDVGATGKSKNIQLHLPVMDEKKTTKRSDGMMSELVNLLAEEKVYRKETKKMINQMVQQNAKILKQFAGFSEQLKKVERFESEIKTLKKKVDAGKMEQTKIRKTISKIQKNHGNFSSTNDLQEVNKTTTLLSMQLESEVNTINYQITKLKNSIDIKNGAVYIRWGRTQCPSSDTKLVYSGYAAGAHYTHHAGTNTQCLPKNPNWRKYHDASNSAAYIYGAEYQLDSYSIGETLHTNFHDYEVPCAVCQSQKRLNVHMIPAKDRCGNGWHLEYRGYLMTQHHSQTASNYVCVDAKAEKIGSKADHNGRLFYPVESICGSLPCPPYVNYRELTCAVCTF